MKNERVSTSVDTTEKRPRRRVVVSHAYYGCDTGCCGHVIEVDEEQVGSFQFNHPYGEDSLEWAKQLVREALGEGHVVDLDWENCVVIDD